MMCLKKSILMAFASLLVACGSGNSVLNIEGGKVSGIPSVEPGVTVFKGIPYAAAPVGDLRWKRPQPVTPWDTVMIADHFGKSAIQGGRTPGSFYYKEFQLSGPIQVDEDCLFLNVWAPTSSLGKDAKLPVAMWVHGGAYMGGCGNDDAFDGDAWAKRGVILVTINYRLGIMGFLSHEGLSAQESDHASGNYGTYDQVAALAWVKNNIAQFGGDPDNITVFGQSAGAASIKNLVSSPLSKGMINRAIIQSGGGLGRFIDTNNTQSMLDSIGKSIMDDAGLTTVEAMRKASVQQILDAAKDRSSMTLCSPHNDPTLIPETFDDATYNNHLADVEYMIGCNGDDMGDMRPGIERFAVVRDSLGNKPVYTYYFDRKLPGDDAGAFHSAELWYMFNTLGRSWRPFTEADYALSEQMMDYWTNFAKYGNPNGKDVDGDWKPCTKASPYLQLLNVQ
ncbi:MAG: carboxylesterase family protein [Bacteroidaceae bacterium]|nr:carboxylesterase family protein [Bacteroidaceae bacterium]